MVDNGRRQTCVQSLSDYHASLRNIPVECVSIIKRRRMNNTLFYICPTIKINYYDVSFHICLSFYVTNTFNKTWRAGASLHSALEIHPGCGVPKYSKAAQRSVKWRKRA